MTNPDTPSPMARAPASDDLERRPRGTDRVTVLVRHTLAAVAGTTDVETRPLDVASPAAPRPGGRRRWRSEAVSDAVPSPDRPVVCRGRPGAVVPVDLGEPRRRRPAAGRGGRCGGGRHRPRRPRRRRRRRPRHRQHRPRRPQPRRRPLRHRRPARSTTRCFVSPPRTVAGFELTDVRGARGWRRGRVAAPPRRSAITVTTNPVLPPFVAAASIRRHHQLHVRLGGATAPRSRCTCSCAPG